MIWRYLVVARLNAQIAMLNRGWVLLRVGGVVAGLVVPYYVWRSVFAGHDQVRQFDWPEIKTYLLLGAAMAILVSDEESTGPRIVNGDLVVDLARPLNMILNRLAEVAGRLAFEAIPVGALWAVVTVVDGGVALPTTAVGGMLFGVSLLLAIALKVAIVHTWTLACFWTYNVYGLDRLRVAVTAVLSGAVVPLALFPPWLETVAEALPFRGLVTLPAEVAIAGGGMRVGLSAIGVQVAWLVVLWLSSALLWRSGLRRLAVQGG